ncbi:pepsin-like aspartic protease [Aspergillus saccharolyticus JOP 1030-1]|uniref:Probable aspartic-type endopeptidase OPSB n=1 Tax=Aspergillus saccharolyticus JOP 1030-1 TaxID=1450539 RepID=A0A318ZMB4_9EURO|nr:acid protease [Aspergillus saccharolyticus JOP 1030-1]PYH48107.1 acid protease [Aspergillus saccharolyticus JOP 1030-1]
MKNTLVLSLACLAQSTSALVLHERAQPATVQYDIHRRQGVSHPRHKRSTPASVDLTNNEVSYTITLNLGTPGQPVEVILDTGSSDLWVNAGNSSSDNPYGTFDSSSSSTFKTVNDEFAIAYVDGSAAVGDYVTDTVAFGNVTLKTFQFGLADESSTQQGVLGVGYASNEFAELRNDEEYANLPQALVNQGYIKSAAYSLWLDDIDAGKGTILFGGINTAKYTGSLHSLPIQAEDGVYSEFAVNLSGVHVTKSGKDISVNNTAFPVLAVLDSGTSLTYLPSGTALDIIETVGAEYFESQGLAVIKCDDAKDSDYEVVFEFSGFNLSISLSDLLVEATFGYCAFGIAPESSTASGGVYLLGDTFLRSAYVVYDLANNEIYLAKTNTNPGSDHVLEIGTGATAVPQVTGSPITQTATATAATGHATGKSDSSSDDKENGTVTAISRSSGLGSLLVGVSSFLALLVAL